MDVCALGAASVLPDFSSRSNGLPHCVGADVETERITVLLKGVLRWTVLLAAHTTQLVAPFPYLGPTSQVLRKTRVDVERYADGRTVEGQCVSRIDANVFGIDRSRRESHSREAVPCAVCFVDKWTSLLLVDVSRLDVRLPEARTLVGTSRGLPAITFSSVLSRFGFLLSLEQRIGVLCSSVRIVSEAESATNFGRRESCFTGGKIRCKCGCDRICDTNDDGKG